MFLKITLLTIPQLHIHSDPNSNHRGVHKGSSIALEKWINQIKSGVLLLLQKQVRHYLGLDNDYDDDCSTSSSDSNSQEDFTLDSTSSSLTDIDLNESDNETIIPPSPKRIKTLNSKRTNGKIVTNTSIQADVSSTCKKQEHGKGACTAQNTTSGNHPSLVNTSHRTRQLHPSS